MSSDDESVHSIIEEIENELELNPENENIEVTETQPADGGNDDGNQDDVEEEERQKRVVKPKRIVKNPQPKLNEETLKGPRGLSAIETHFQRVKFKGRGHEEHDLNVLMKTYEYWCHRLYPMFPFDSVIARLETLGTKRNVQTYLKRIRLGMTVAEHQLAQSEDEDEENVPEETQTQENINDDIFDHLLPGDSVNQPTQEIELTEELQERIRKNKEKAERIRRERLQKAAEPSQGVVDKSEEQVSEVSDKSHRDDRKRKSNRIDSDEELELDRSTREKSQECNNVEEEASIDDLLGQINSEQSVSQKRRKKHTIESDDDPDKELNRKNNDENMLNETSKGRQSDSDEEAGIYQEDNDSKGKKPQTEESDDEEETSNNLSEGSIDDQTVSQKGKKRNIIESDEDDQDHDNSNDEPDKTTNISKENMNPNIQDSINE